MAICLGVVSTSFAESASKALQSKVFSVFDSSAISAKAPQALLASADLGSAVKTSKAATEAEFEITHAAFDAIWNDDIDTFKSELDKIEDINVLFSDDEDIGEMNLLIPVATLGDAEDPDTSEECTYTEHYEAAQYLIDRGIDVNFVWEINDKWLAEFYGGSHLTAVDVAEFSGDVGMVALIQAAGGKRFSEL